MFVKIEKNDTHAKNVPPEIFSLLPYENKSLLLINEQLRFKLWDSKLNEVSGMIMRGFLLNFPLFQATVM